MDDMAGRGRQASAPYVAAPAKAACGHIDSNTEGGRHDARLRANASISNGADLAAAPLSRLCCSETLLRLYMGDGASKITRYLIHQAWQAGLGWCGPLAQRSARPLTAITRRNGAAYSAAAREGESAYASHHASDSSTPQHNNERSSLIPAHAARCLARLPHGAPPATLPPPRVTLLRCARVSPAREEPRVPPSASSKERSNMGRAPLLLQAASLARLCA